MKPLRLTSLGLIVLLSGSASALASPAPSTAAALAAESGTASPVTQLRAEAVSLRPLFRSQLVARFLAGTAQLPEVAPRTVYCDSARTRCWTPAQAAGLPDTMRARLVERALDEDFYYVTRYGSPLAYARPLEILAGAGGRELAGERAPDFRYR